jgi:hypothetical protein
MGASRLAAQRCHLICQEGLTMSEQKSHRMLSSRAEFQDALRDAFELAAQQGCRELFISDVDFADWPLGEPALVESLSRWAYAHRRITVLAHHFDELPRRHPRWVAWRRQWDHVITCRAWAEAEPEQMPTMLLAPGLVTVRLFDAQTWRASVSTEHADAVRARELFDAVLQRSTDAFPASTLGL